MSRDSLGYDRIALKANADGAPINFQLHQQIKGAVSLPLTTAVAASAADSAIDHLSPQEEVRHHGHAQAGVLSAQIFCGAVSLSRFGQEDMLRDAPAP